VHGVTSVGTNPHGKSEVRIGYRIMTELGCVVGASLEVKKNNKNHKIFEICEEGEGDSGYNDGNDVYVSKSHYIGNGWYDGTLRLSDLYGVVRVNSPVGENSLGDKVAKTTNSPQSSAADGVVLLYSNALAGTWVNATQWVGVRPYFGTHCILTCGMKDEQLSPRRIPASIGWLIGQQICHKDVLVIECNWMWLLHIVKYHMARLAHRILWWRYKFNKGVVNLCYWIIYFIIKLLVLTLYTGKLMKYKIMHTKFWVREHAHTCHSNSDERWWVNNDGVMSPRKRKILYRRIVAGVREWKRKAEIRAWYTAEREEGLQQSIFKLMQRRSQETHMDVAKKCVTIDEECSKFVRQAENILKLSERNSWDTLI